MSHIYVAICDHLRFPYVLYSLTKSSIVACLVYLCCRWRLALHSFASQICRLSVSPLIRRRNDLRSARNISSNAWSASSCSVALFSLPCRTCSFMLSYMLASPELTVSKKQLAPKRRVTSSCALSNCWRTVSLKQAAPVTRLGSMLKLNSMTSSVGGFSVVVPMGSGASGCSGEVVIGIPARVLEVRIWAYCVSCRFSGFCADCYSSCSFS
jgi:hypothetical protein